MGTPGKKSKSLRTGFSSLGASETTTAETAEGEGILAGETNAGTGSASRSTTKTSRAGRGGNAAAAVLAAARSGESVIPSNGPGDGTTQTGTTTFPSRRAYSRKKLPDVKIRFNNLIVGSGLDEEGRLRLMIKVKKAVRAVLAAHHPETLAWTIDMHVLQDTGAPVGQDIASAARVYEAGSALLPNFRPLSPKPDVPTHQASVHKRNGSHAEHSPDESDT